MQPGSFWLPFVLSALAFAQAEKPADNTKIFGPPPPGKVDKNKLRTVTGVVRDEQGNIAPGAVVYLKDVKTGKERSMIVGPDGAFSFDELNKAYDYQLRATKDKLASRLRTLSSFDTRLKPTMNLALEPAPVAPAKASAPETSK